MNSLLAEITRKLLVATIVSGVLVGCKNHEQKSETRESVPDDTTSVPQDIPNIAVQLSNEGQPEENAYFVNIGTVERAQRVTICFGDLDACRQDPRVDLKTKKLEPLSEGRLQFRSEFPLNVTQNPNITITIYGEDEALLAIEARKFIRKSP